MAGQRTALIAGAGLAGSLMACYLVRAGWRVRVHERRPDPRAKGYVGGRSINLALSARGLHGLAGVGLDKHILEHDAIPMRGRMIHPVSGPTVFQPYSAKASDAINSVSRGGLNVTLLNLAAKERGVEFVFDRTCLDVEPDAGCAIFQTETGTERVEADLVIGADGAFSAVRGRMQKTERFEYSQSYLEHGYKELHIPARSGGFAMEPGALHIWPRGGAMMIALPNRDSSFTCTLFWPWEKSADGHGLSALRTKEEVEAFFRERYPDAVPLMPTLAEDFSRNPNGSLVTVRCRPRVQGRSVLIGDAAHAIVPFYGQGMNCAFEDCRELAACLAKHRDQGEALAEYEAARKPNADAIANMALENFVEMRDKTGRPEFLYRKKVEQAVHALFPDRWTPQYNLVSFSTVPYVEARRRGRELDAVLDGVIGHVPAERTMELGDEKWREEVRRAVRELGAVVGNPPPAPSLREGEQAGAAGAGGATPGLRTGARSPSSVREGAWIDISPVVSPRLAVWPGDTPASREVLCDIAKGDTVTLSTLRATVHLGAHADGPNHYGLGAPDISKQKLEHYVGPCQVIAARVNRGGRVSVADLETPVSEVRHPRVLIKTGTFPDPEKWNTDFAALSVELVEALAAKGVITIGIDTPSVDLQESKELPAHGAILKAGIAILEGLVLRGVEPGEYELMALPLRLEGFDASPVRAVLRR